MNTPYYVKKMKDRALKRILLRNTRVSNNPHRNVSTLEERKKLGYLINTLAYAGKVASDAMLEIVLKALTDAEKEKIIREARCAAKNMKAGIRKEIFADDDAIWRTKESVIERIFSNGFLKPGLNRHIMSLLLLKQEKENRKKKAITLEKRLENISSIFGLNATETELVLLLYLVTTDTIADKLFDEISYLIDARNYPGNGTRSTRPLYIMTGILKNEVQKAFCEHATLKRAGLITDERELAEEIVEYLDGNSTVPMSKRYFSEFSGEPVPLEHHNIDKRHVDTIQTIIRHKPKDHGVNILLYGIPGTGKTEFARALGRHLSMSVYEVINFIEKEDQVKDMCMFRLRALFACQKIVDIQKSLIIVDEADALLNSTPAFFSMSSTAEKGQINKVLDDSRGNIIWITNRYDGIDDSTKRRFDYSIGFDKLTYTQRMAVWQVAMQRHDFSNIFTSEELERFASTYETSAGGIDIALRNAKQITMAGETKEKTVQIVENILRAHLKIIDEKEKFTDIREANAPAYSLGGLTIKGQVNETVQILNKFNTYWNEAGESMAVRNMNVLLYGPPGSGKTEFAKYVARQMKRRLIVKRASDILSMWVGESEKIIRQAFHEAEKDKAILFIDEADGLLCEREGAGHSWEITQVNEMLTNMESFRGMLICATNFKRIVDSAAIRRFNIKLEFDYLKPEGAVTFYNIFMKNLVEPPLSDQQSALVGNIPSLTPGDFKVVYQKYSFLDKKDLSHDRIIEALREEIRAKNANAGKTMGFAGV